MADITTGAAAAQDLTNPAPGTPTDIGSAAAAADDKSSFNEKSPTPSADIKSNGTNTEPLSVRDFILKGLEETEKPDVEDKTSADGNVEVRPAEDEKTADTSLEPEKPEQPEKETPGIAHGDDTKQPEADAKADKTDESEKPTRSLRTREEIDRDFARTSKEIREVAATNAEIALEYKKDLEELGGEHFLQPMKAIAGGFLEGSNIPVFTGVMSAVGVEGFMNFLEDAVKVALIDTQTSTPRNEAESYLQQRCQEMLNNVFAEKFGPNASLAYFGKLYRYDQEGLLNTTDVDEFYGQDDNGEQSWNPLLKQRDEEIAALKAQIEETKADSTVKIRNEEIRHADEFEKHTLGEANKVLEDLYFKKSVLRPIKGDAPELAEIKEKVQSLLLDNVNRSLKEHPDFIKLQKSDYKGEKNTASFKRRYASLIDHTLFAAKDAGRGLEALVSMVYKLSRNGSLEKPDDVRAAIKEGNGSAASGIAGTPTETKKAEKADISPEAWRRHLVEQLSS